MADNRSRLQRMIEEHGHGTIPKERVLDTPEKREAYLRRMEEATREGFEKDRRARAASWLKARDRIVF